MPGARKKRCRIPADCAPIKGKSLGQGLERNTESLIRPAGIKKCQREKGTMRVPGDFAFLDLLEDLNGRLELAHIAQRAGELNECLSLSSFASAAVKKIVWRVSGTGEPIITLTSPSGEELTLAWGPEFHASSNYVRPGDEYGSGLVLDEPGCWNIDFSRDAESANVQLDVST